MGDRVRLLGPMSRELRVEASAEGAKARTPRGDALVAQLGAQTHERAIGSPDGQAAEEAVPCVCEFADDVIGSRSSVPEVYEALFAAASHHDLLNRVAIGEGLSLIHI